MKSNKKLFFSAASAILALSLSGCTPTTPADPPKAVVTPTPGSGSDIASYSLFSADEEFSSRDLSGEYYDNVEEISLSDKDGVNISAAGTYVLSGELQGGVVVEAGDGDKVQLVLDGAEISSSSGAAIYVKSADKVFVTLKEGTQNFLSSSSADNSEDDNIDGVIFSKSDLTLNGAGTLTVLSPGGHGIVSKDSLVITGGKYEISATGRALSGKDCVCISGGEFNMESGKDSVRSEHADDEARGYVYITAEILHA